VCLKLTHSVQGLQRNAKTPKMWLRVNQHLPRHQSGTHDPFSWGDSSITKSRGNDSIQIPVVFIYNWFVAGFNSLVHRADVGSQNPYFMVQVNSLRVFFSSKVKKINFNFIISSLCDQKNKNPMWLIQRIFMWKNASMSLASFQ